MATSFSQTKKYRDLSHRELREMSEDDAWHYLKILRWGDSKTTQCPNCLVTDEHYYIKTRKQWTCKGCSHRFSLTSNTPLHARKLPFIEILGLVFRFVSSPQGTSVNSSHSTLGTTVKTVFHNFGKIREVLYETQDRSPMKGIVQIDCGHFGGKPRRANRRKPYDSAALNSRLRNRKDAIVPDKKHHPEPWNVEKLKNRRIVLVLSECDNESYDGKGSSRTLAFVLKKEKSETIMPILKKYVSRDALIWSDSGSAFSKIEILLGNKHFKVNHSVEYQTLDGVNNNLAEGVFSRIRRAEFGAFNGFRPQYMAFYAAEFCWRNDVGKMSLKQKFDDIFLRIFKKEKSKAFCNYNHGHRLGFEHSY